MYNGSRRLGKVWISEDFINKDPLAILQAFAHAGFFPLHIIGFGETYLTNNVYEYIGICESFQILEEGAVIPLYSIEVSEYEGQPTATVVKL